MPALMDAHEAQVKHMLGMDPEAFAAWDPSSAEAQFISILRGDTILQDLTIPDLPTGAGHVVSGTFVIQNPFWRTTINCTRTGDQPFTIPRFAFHSINCGPQSRCNGGAMLNIFPDGPATAGMALGPQNSIGKVNGFDRVLIVFSFSLPATAGEAK
jgi:hypothetical protein